MAQIVKNNNKTKYDDVDKVLDNNKSKKAAAKPKKQSNNKQTKKEIEKKRSLGKIHDILSWY